MITVAKNTRLWKEPCIAFELWCWRRLESPLDCKEIKPVNPKGNQFWMFIGRTDAEAEAPILWPPDGENWLIGKDSDAGKDWRQEEKGMTEVKMVGWHHQLDGHVFEQALGAGDGQGGLACCSPRGDRVGHNWVTELKWMWRRQIVVESSWLILSAAQNFHALLSGFKTFSSSIRFPAFTLTSINKP